MSVVDVKTGELLDLTTAGTCDLAGALDGIRDHEADLRDAKRQISEEIIRRMDRAREWTLHEPGFKLTGKSDAPVVQWDVQQLMDILEELVSEDFIDQSVIGNVIETKVEYRVRARAVEALRKNPEIRERVDRARQEFPPADRRVSVSRA